MDLYEAIFTRRDVRRFRPDPVPDAALERMLRAAHAAPSVGFMQPWDFVVIRSPERRLAVRRLFEAANAAARTRFAGARRALYDRLRLEGIREAPVNLCVTCDRSRGGPHVLGRDSIPETDLYSTCCAVQNLWLAARAEGLGVGWVSVLGPAELAALLELPATVVPVAYLCVGYPERLLPEPELALAGWRQRLPLARLVHGERWGRPDAALAAWLDEGCVADLAEVCR